MRFSFLGLGNMGAPLARNILLAGEELTVFTRRPECAAAFAAEGAAVASVDLAAKDLRLGCAMARAWGCEPRLTEDALGMFKKRRRRAWAARTPAPCSGQRIKKRRGPSPASRNHGPRPLAG